VIISSDGANNYFLLDLASDWSDPDAGSPVVTRSGE